jgi:Ni/Co efflux regulator RcnB
MSGNHNERSMTMKYATILTLALSLLGGIAYAAPPPHPGGQPGGQQGPHDGQGQDHRGQGQGHQSNQKHRTQDHRTQDHRNTSRWTHGERRNLHSQRRFHVDVYHSPRGYHYRRWHYGERLPRIYWAREFWLTDFLMFDLMAPPPGCIWVRFGPDALLIDEETGEIIRVVYGVFY